MKMLDLDNINALGRNNFRTNPISECTEKNRSGYGTADEHKSSLVKTYPWILEFRKLCLGEMMNSNMRSLMKLTKFYIKNIKNAVEDCYQRPKRAAKLKIEISKSLMFFHYAYKETKSPLEHFSYLEKMSDLMAMYMDMEIKASRIGIESIRKVASMITSSLKIYFGNYKEYVLDAILKTNIITKRHWFLGDLIFRWVLRDCPESQMDIITYIRYLLVFKMWKEIMQQSKEEQQNIIKLACLKLQPPINLKEKLELYHSLRDFFPIVPNSNITKFLMKAKFSSRDKAKIFFKILANPVLVGHLNYLSNPVSDSSGLIEKDITPVDRLLNDMWVNMNSYKSVNINMLILPSNQMIQRPKYKRKVEVIESDIEDSDTKPELKKKTSNSLSICRDKDHSIKLEMEDDLIDSTDQHPCNYEHSIEDLSYTEEENKDVDCWKSDLEVEAKKERENMMKEHKLEDHDTSVYHIQKSDLEDEIICSSDECIFDLMVDLNEGGKGNTGEYSSTLPFKKRRGLSFNKDTRNDSEISSRQFSRNYLMSQSLESVLPLNSSASNSNCEECNMSECMNSEECNVSECINSEECNTSLPYNANPSIEQEERKITFKTPAQLKVEERKMTFKTPAQLKAFHNFFYESPDLINLALGSQTDYFHGNKNSHAVSREADTLSDEKPAVVKRKATTTSGRRRRRKGRGRPKKKKISEKTEDSNRLLDELTTTAGLKWSIFVTDSWIL